MNVTQILVFMDHVLKALGNTPVTVKLDGLVMTVMKVSKLPYLHT